MHTLQEVEKEYLRTDLPDFRAGDTVRVHVKVAEGDKVVMMYTSANRDETVFDDPDAFVLPDLATAFAEIGTRWGVSALSPWRSSRPDTLSPAGAR